MRELRNVLERTLLHHRGNRTRSARDLGIARTTLIKKSEKYGLEV
ncbi:MAG: helix-turn-helix domain-containing protein [Gemmatimonadota bacterium]